MPAATRFTTALQAGRKSLGAVTVGLLVFLLALGACRKQAFLEGDRVALAFSTDTLLFDTVFTQLGSTTRRFKVFNNGNQPVRITEIYLAGRKLSGQSAYRLNINGQPTNALKDVELEGGDSLYVFGEVTIDPTAGAAPFVIRDSVAFVTGGTTRFVQLAAFGQNNNVLSALPFNVVTKDTVWDASLPILLYTPVLIRAGVTVTILAGTRVYSTRFSGVFVEGTLRVEGGCDSASRVRFQGDRLDAFYRDLPGGWQGINVIEGGKAEIENAEIRNATYGVVVDNLGTGGFAARLRNVEIHNIRLVGLWGFTGSIRAENTLVYDCGQYLVLGQGGGAFEFVNCTFANTNTMGRFPISNPAIGLTTEPYERDDVPFTAPLTATFANCIVWGTQDEEIGTNEVGGIPFNLSLDNTLITAKDERYDGANQVLNKDPLFKDIAKQDFTLKPVSPAFGQGNPATATADDLECRPRAMPPALGALEAE